MVKVCVDSLAGPALMPVRSIVCSPAFSRIGVMGVIVSIVGGWLTALTVTGKVWVTVSWPPLATPPLSITGTVIVAVPLSLLASGANVRIAPLGLLGLG